MSSNNVIDLRRVQLIQGEAGPTHAVVPYDLWKRIDEALQHADGPLAAGSRRPADPAEAEMSDEELLATADTSGETFPLDVVEQLSRGVHPVKVYRQYRCLTQAELAARIGSAASYISQIEGGRPCGRQTLDLLARALGVDMEDLMPWNTDGDRPAITIQKEPEWNGDREAVSFIGTWGAEGISYFRVSGEALSNLERGNVMSRDAALAAFRRHEVRILDACSRAVAEGREKVDDVAILTTTADFD